MTRHCRHLGVAQVGQVGQVRSSKTPFCAITLDRGNTFQRLHSPQSPSLSKLPLSTLSLSLYPCCITLLYLILLCVVFITVFYPDSPESSSFTFLCTLFLSTPLSLFLCNLSLLLNNYPCHCLFPPAVSDRCLILQNLFFLPLAALRVFSFSLK